jgi:hypothetical protein
MFEYICKNWKGIHGTYQRIQEFGESKLLLIELTC